MSIKTQVDKEMMSIKTINKSKLKLTILSRNQFSLTYL